MKDFLSLLTSSWDYIEFVMSLTCLAVLIWDWISSPFDEAISPTTKDNMVMLFIIGTMLMCAAFLHGAPHVVTLVGYCLLTACWLLNSISDGGLVAELNAQSWWISGAVGILVTVTGVYLSVNDAIYDWFGGILLITGLFLTRGVFKRYFHLIDDA